MKWDDSPLNKVLLNILPIINAIIIPKAYKENNTKPP